MAQQKQVVFTTGAGRGGTTLLNLVLGNLEGGLALGELAGLPGQLGEMPGSPCRLCAGDCPIWDRNFSEHLTARHWPFKRPGRMGRLLDKAPLTAKPGPGIYEDIFERSGADTLFDSSKSLTWVEARLADRRDWRTARPVLLMITRDGRAVVNSHRRKDKSRSAENYAEAWAERMVWLERMFSAFDPTRRMRVSYEALATDPESVVARICGLLDKPYDASLLRYWEGDHHTLGGNKGTQSLIHRARETLETVDGAMPDAKRRAHYLSTDLGIKLDERWREEMSEEDLAGFTRVAGEVNATYAHGP